MYRKRYHETEEFEKLRKAALSNWIWKNVTMDSNEDETLCLFDAVTLAEDLCDNSFKLDRICDRNHSRNPELATAAIYRRGEILEKKLAEAGINTSKSMIEILEACRVFRREELDRDDMTSPDPFWDDFRSGDFDHDSYSLKIEAAENWDSCCLFIGYRNELNKMALMFLANIAPENCRFVLFADFSRKGLAETLERAIEHGDVETDLDKGPGDGKACLWYVNITGLRDASFENLGKCQATLLSRHSYSTHEWSSLNEDSDDMFKVLPYPEMPEIIGRLFEHQIYAEAFTGSEKAELLRKLQNTRYLHTWDVKAAVEKYLETLSFGISTKGDSDRIVSLMGSPYILLNDDNDWSPDVIETWIEEHGKDVAAKEEISMWTDRLWGISSLWNDVDIDWDKFKWEEKASNRIQMLEDAKPEAGISYIDCFWNHGVPVEDVFA